MAKTITCPKCGNYGEARVDNKGAFEVRGQYEGKPVRKCSKCGSGIYLGMLGKAKLIPTELWKRMEELWNKEFKENLTTEHVSELLCLLFTGENADVFKQVNDIVDGKIFEGHEISANRANIFLTLSSLFLFAYIRASSSDKIEIVRDLKVKISHDMATMIVTVLCSMIENNDVDVLNELMEFQANLTQEYMKIWNDNQSSEPGPHWYVGKQACNNIEIENDPSAIMYFSEILHNNTMSIVELITDLQNKYDITE